MREADPLLAAAYGSYLGVPVVGPDSGVVGVLAVYGREPRRWRLEEEEALAALAATAATAYLNADLYQGVSHEQQRSEAILTNIADGIVAIDREGRVVLGTPPRSGSRACRSETRWGAPPSTPWVGRSCRIGSVPAERAS